jgi:type VI secretion system protein ImpF
LPENFPELHSSLLNYGLPDLQSLEIRQGRAGQQIAHLIEEVIRDFEPRLRGVRVRSKGLDNHASDSLRQLSFEIDAVLVIEPLKEPVLFTSSFNSISGEFNVEGG